VYCSNGDSGPPDCVFHESVPSRLGVVEQEGNRDHPLTRATASEPHLCLGHYRFLSKLARMLDQIGHAHGPVVVGIHGRSDEFIVAGDFQDVRRALHRLIL